MWTHFGWRINCLLAQRRHNMHIGWLQFDTVIAISTVLWKYAIDVEILIGLTKIVAGMVQHCERKHKANY